MIKKLFITTFAFLSFTCLIAQNEKTGVPPQRTCGTEIPSQQWDEWFNKKVAEYKDYLVANKMQLPNYTIPVVVHIIHAGGAVGVGDNISQAQVVDQINILNADFAGTGTFVTNCPAVFQPVIANSGISFCLAVTDPTAGTMPEPGIDRVLATSITGITSVPAGGFPTATINNTIKPATIWDPTKYCNMWVLKLQNGLLGYATFPLGTTLPGVTGGGSNTNDGVVMGHNYFGSIGSAAASAPYQYGRTTTHELGHWLGLRHTWGDGNCLTDFCNDTPTAKTSNFGCKTHPFGTNQCGAGTSPNGEMTMNFMDYSDDPCMYMFTNDQKTRMLTAMSQGTYRNLLGTHGLCSVNPPNPGPAVAQFDINNPCVGQPITPYNSSTGGPSPTYAWSASPTSVTFAPNANVAAPAITFGNLTTYTLYLTATNSVNVSTTQMVLGPLLTCPKPAVCLDTLKMIQNVDTLTTYLAPNNSLILGCQSGYAGFLTGTNCYKDKEFAQYYPSSTYSDTPIPQVNSVIVLFDSLGTKATPSTQGTQIFCKVYGGTVGSGPNSLITSKGDSLGKIAASTNKTVTIKYCGTPNYTFTTTKIIPFRFDFAVPIQIPSSGFFCSVQTPYGSLSDSIQIFSNTKTNISNDSSSWVLQFSNNWRTLRYNKNAKVQLAILPQITCRSVVGIQENVSTFNSNVTVMPNPSNGQFSLIFTLPKQENVNVRIINTLGQLISSDKLENVTNNLINIDMSNRPDGIYFIEVSNGNEKVLKKIIITH
ncbi:MAG: T9SS type A sorting domain-containing protein [Bacteroidota bacterium]|nr:T9SS type A sorting domain-containing protein [Bacteroidota bacterium]MDP3146448.1 T9SS type A sorting domain-containing protein [Bacteroidota bacterium]MDP3557434.1 T9SS type A sorting domain-containing protein [Bacteroidota bacterium]